MSPLTTTCFSSSVAIISPLLSRPPSCSTFNAAIKDGGNFNTSLAMNHDIYSADLQAMRSWVFRCTEQANRKEQLSEERVNRPRSLVPRGHTEKSASSPPPPPAPIFLKEGERSCLGRRPPEDGSIDECPSFAFSSRETRLESGVFEIITSISHVCVVGVYVFLALFDYCC